MYVLHSHAWILLAFIWILAAIVLLDPLLKIQIIHQNLTRLDKQDIHSGGFKRHPNVSTIVDSQHFVYRCWILMIMNLCHCGLKCNWLQYSGVEFSCILKPIVASFAIRISFDIFPVKCSVGNLSGIVPSCLKGQIMRKYAFHFFHCENCSIFLPNWTSSPLSFFIHL